MTPIWSVFFRFKCLICTPQFPEHAYTRSNCFIFPYVCCLLSGLTLSLRLTFKISCSLVNFEADMTDKRNGKCRTYLTRSLENISVRRHVSFQALRLVDFTANDASVTLSPKKKWVLFISHMLLLAHIRTYINSNKESARVVMNILVGNGHCDQS